MVGSEMAGSQMIGSHMARSQMARSQTVQVLNGRVPSGPGPKWPGPKRSRSLMAGSQMVPKMGSDKHVFVEEMFELSKFGIMGFPTTQRIVWYPGGLWKKQFSPKS